MVNISADDYDALKGFFAWMWDHQFPIMPGLPPEARPLAVIEAFEAKSMAMARKSLGMGIGDTVEMTQDLAPQHVREIDASLAALALPTLSEVRARFWTKVRGIMKRGTVRNEGEYHALRNVVEAMPEPEQAAGWQMLGEFEARVGGDGSS